MVDRVETPSPMVIGVIGQVPQLMSETAEEREIFSEQLEFFFEANNIEGNRRKAILFSNTGPVVYRQIRKLCKPRFTADITYNEAVDLLNTHFNPKQNVWLSRKIFKTRNQLPSESFKDFVANLRLLAQSCDYQEVENELLQRLILGMRNTKLQEKIFSDTTGTVTFTSVYAQPVDAEVAKGDVVALQQQTTPSTSSQSVHKSSARYIGSGHPESAQATQIRGACNAGGDMHSYETCKFRAYTCHYCKRGGYITRACRKKKADIEGKQPKVSNHRGRGGKQQCKPARTMQVTESIDQEESPYTATGLFLCHTPSPKAPPALMVLALVGEVVLSMEVDTGAGHTIIEYDIYQSQFGDRKLETPELLLKTWSQEDLKVKGMFSACIKLNGYQAMLPMAVMEQPGSTLLGRPCFSALGISVNGIHGVSSSETSSRECLKPYKQVFAPGLGGYCGPPARIHLKPGTTPVFRKARAVPFALHDRVGKEIDRMVAAGILEPVTHSDWATPTVNVDKRDGSIRICGDFSGTVNPACQCEVYPLPTIDELLSKLNWGKVFAKFDLAQAFLQILVDEDTSKILTLNTHKGLYRMKRLSPGLSSASTIFQRLSETLLLEIPGVVVYMDDVLCTTSSEQKLWHRTKQVTDRFSRAGLRLRLEKCVFNVKSLEYVGHFILGDGIKPTDSKVQELLATPSPTNKEELKTFLGFINYYDRFFKNKSTM